jgi:hypothetical protein
MTGYIPAIRYQVKFVFIPKPGRNSYSGPRDFRLISLTSFLLKTMERMVDRFLRDEILAIMPLHPNQHTYQAGKSVETALHQLTFDGLAVRGLVPKKTKQSTRTCMLRDNRSDGLYPY